MWTDGISTFNAENLFACGGSNFPAAASYPRSTLLQTMFTIAISQTLSRQFSFSPKSTIRKSSKFKDLSPVPVGAAAGGHLKEN